MIKFRVWDLNMKKYFPQYLVNELTLNIINSGAFIVEQFTGLTDKNGKDIYLGDIVVMYEHIYETVGHPSQPNYDETTIFEGDKIGVVVRNSTETYVKVYKQLNYEDGKMTKVNQKRRLKSKEKRLVIGNINENKELLE